MKSNESYQKINTGSIETYALSFPKKEENVYAQLFVRAGYCFAEPGERFIPHLLEHTISNKMMQNELDFEAYSGTEHLTFYLQSKKENFTKDFEIFIKSIFDNDFPKENYENEKKALVNELIDKGAEFESKSFADLSKIRYKSIYYSRDLFNKKDVQESKISEIKKYQEKYFKDKNVKLFLGARQFDDKTLNKVKKIISNTKILKGKRINFPKPGQYSKKCYIKEKYDSPKSHLIMTWPCPSYEQSIEDRIGINIIREVLVSGYKAVLFQKLRTEHGIVYEIDAETIMMEKVGAFSINVAVEKDNIKKTIEIIKTSIDEIKNGKIDKKLLGKIIEDHIDSNKKEWSSNNRFDWIVGDLVDFDEVHDVKDLNKINRSVNIDFLSKVAKKYLDHEYLNIIEYSK